MLLSNLACLDCLYKKKKSIRNMEEGTKRPHLNTVNSKLYNFAKGSVT